MVWDRGKIALGIWLLLITAGGAWFLQWKSPQAQMVVAAHDIPAYARVARRDLKISAVARRALPADAMAKPEDLVGRYVREAIPTGRPVRRSVVTPAEDIKKLADGTVAIPMDATPAQAFGGRLKCGDVVAVWDRNANRVLLERVLVLDVLPVRGEGAMGSRYVLVLAVPSVKQGDFLAAAARGVDFVRGS
jgi:Flp pilus assembly protein CpaB